MKPSHTTVSFLRLTSVALACLGSLPAFAALPAGAAAEIINIQGTGEQRPPKATDWRTAKASQALPAGSFVRTLDATKMALMFADDTQLRLNQNTVLEVKAVAGAGQPTTSLSLSAGRLWAQTKRADGSRLNIETPAAVAAIRGTDWDLEVGADGKTMITVLSGTVAFSNALGNVSVGANEAAIAEVGKAPVKLLLSQPKDRVQWVNALSANPLPHLQAQEIPASLASTHAAMKAGDIAGARQAWRAARAAAPPEWADFFDSALRLSEGDLAGARAQLKTLLAGPRKAPVAAWLVQSDLQVMDGDSTAATNTLQAGLGRWPEHPSLIAQLAHALLLSDRLDESESTLTSAPKRPHTALALARAELARRRGDLPGTLQAYTEATQLAPKDSRGWLGLGSAHNEREDSALARKLLQQAASIDARAEGLQGELGTLETFANRFDAADTAFEAALADNPGDYVALSGLGLLRLKQGRTEDGLAALLRAGVMEPRYARAKTWTAVAYYQLGRHTDAISTLQQAIALDDKDPVPYMFLAQIHTDQFQPGEAVDAARAAVQRMPNLKSLNQLANDQKGSANLGASLAFFGMEDWALELAQQSFSPFWGGSHLFLADRYRGEFNKNSELFQGFLTDPLAFGAGQKHSSLLVMPGVHGEAAVTLISDPEWQRTPSLSINGMDNTRIPMAWFVKTQHEFIDTLPLNVASENLPYLQNTPNFESRSKITTFGIGLQPTEKINMFGYLNGLNAGIQANNNFDLSLGTGSDVRSTFMGGSKQLGAFGLAYRWSPVEQTWLKIGRTLEGGSVTNQPTAFAPLDVTGIISWNGVRDIDRNDYQIRHIFDPQPGTRWSISIERGLVSQGTNYRGTGPIAMLNSSAQPQLIGDMQFLSLGNLERGYTGLTLSGFHRIREGLSIEGALAFENLETKVRNRDIFSQSLTTEGVNVENLRNESSDSVNPRLGLVFNPVPGATLRLAYQDWIRPFSTSSLNQVETAGIAAEDQLVEAGGRQKRLAIQWGQELDNNTFFSFRADRMRISNPTPVASLFNLPNIPGLSEIRSTRLDNLASFDLLEAIPSFEVGTLSKLSLAINHMLNSRWSVYGKYIYQDSNSEYADARESSGVAGNRWMPFVPRQTTVLGSTWASGKRFYFSTRVVLRSERYEDKENLSLRTAGWSADLIGYWESFDKRWMLGAAALNFWGQSAQWQPTRYGVDARYRF
jgi:tetratricopeptide (TPR) repeat protein